MAWIKQESENAFIYWKPEKEGEEVIGVITEINVKGKYGKDYTLKTESGEDMKLPSHKVLQNRMAKVQVNDRVKIVFINEQAPKIRGDNPTMMYDVFIDKLTEEKV